MHACMYICTMAHPHPVSVLCLWWILNCPLITFLLHSWMHSQILFPSSIPAPHPLAQSTHPPSRWSGWTTPPSPQPCAPRHMSPNPWRPVGYPPQSVGQYQGVCALMAGWIHGSIPSLSTHTSWWYMSSLLHSHRGYRTARRQKSYAHTDGFRLSHN